MRKRFFSIIVCVVMLFTMNVTAFAAETQENYSETEKTMTFEITPTALNGILSNQRIIKSVEDLIFQFSIFRWG